MQRSVGFIVCVGVVLFGAAIAGAQGMSAAQAPAFSHAMDRAAVLKVMTAAADWQLDHPSTHAPYDWTQAAFYTGMMALAGVHRLRRSTSTR